MARIAIYGNGGAPYNHAAILKEAGHEVEFVFAVDIIAGALLGFDAFVMPGGGYRSMAGQLEPLGAKGATTIREYVRGGGMYVGSCAGSYDAAVTPDAFLELVPFQTELRLVDARVWNSGDSSIGVIQSPGIGELVVSNAAPAHPVMVGMPATFQITHYNGPLFTGGTVLARVLGTSETFTPAERFLGGDADELLIERGVAEGVANIVADEFGAGKVVLFGSHPEFGTTPALDDRSPAARLLLNAVDWQAGVAHSEARPCLTTQAPIEPRLLQTDRDGLSHRVAAIRHLVQQLGELPADPPWLNDDQALAQLGRSGAEVWSAALVEIPARVAEAARIAGEEGRLPDHIVSFRPNPSWPVDGGFWGIAPLLEQVEGLLFAAVKAAPGSYPTVDGYDTMHTSPYHLVAGSYLAAVGRSVGAALLARAFSPSSIGGGSIVP